MLNAFHKTEQMYTEDLYISCKFISNRKMEGILIPTIYFEMHPNKMCVCIHIHKHTYLHTHGLTSVCVI